MAARFWVGGGSTANWNATVPTNWGSASGVQDGVAVPTTTDDVTFDGAGVAGNTDSTISAAITIKTLTITSGYTKTLTHNTFTLTISGDTFQLGSAMTAYTLANASTSAVSFTSTTGTSGAPTTVTTNGKTLGNVTFSSVGGYFKLQDNLTISSTASLKPTQGTFDTNAKTLDIGFLNYNNVNTKVLTFTNSSITIRGASGLTGNSSGTTFNMSGSTITVVGTGTFNGTGSTFGNVVFTATTQTLSGGDTFNDLQAAPSGASTALSFTSGTTTTCTTLTTDSTNGWISFRSTLAGSTATLSVGSVQTPLKSTGNNNGYIRDMILTGTAAPIDMTRGFFDGGSATSGAIFAMLINTGFSSSVLEYSQITLANSASGTLKWYCPPNVTKIKVECWGGNGGGGGVIANANAGGGGGGSGGYSVLNSLSVTPGTVYTITLGVSGGSGLSSGSDGGAGGDTWFSTSGTVLAKGGLGGKGSTAGTGAGGAAGLAASGVGDTKFSGAAGGNGVVDNVTNVGGGGGGAGSAGSTSDGSVGGNASGSTAGTGGAGGSGVANNTTAAHTGGAPGGNGGAGGGIGTAGVLGQGGGGGAGVGSAAKTGGSGRAGMVMITPIGFIGHDVTDNENSPGASVSVSPGRGSSY